MSLVQLADSRAPKSAQGVVDEDVDGILAAFGERFLQFSGKTLLITGASGFLPSYMVDTLAQLNRSGVLSRPCRLILLARNPERLSARLGHLLGRPDIQVLVQDAVHPIPELDQLDYIVHAAAPASPAAYRNDPVGSLDVNLMALRSLLELARQKQCESFLYFSSSEVYGTPEADSIPTPESYLGRVDTLGKRACYAEAKRAGESYCAAFHEQYGVPVKIVRPFHVHGPGLRLDDGRIVMALIKMGLLGSPFGLQSDGRATRTYGYVSDATVDFFDVLLSNCNGQAFNVGVEGPETSILELATLVSRIFGRDQAVLVNHGANPEHSAGSPARACPDLSKIRAAFGRAPRIPLEEGLRRTVEWNRRQLSLP